MGTLRPNVLLHPQTEFEFGNSVIIPTTTVIQKAALQVLTPPPTSSSSPTSELIYFHLQPNPGQRKLHSSPSVGRAGPSKSSKWLLGPIRGWGWGPRDGPRNRIRRSPLRGRPRPLSRANRNPRPNTPGLKPSPGTASLEGQPGPLPLTSTSLLREARARVWMTPRARLSQTRERTAGLLSFPEIRDILTHGDSRPRNRKELPLSFLKL